MQHLLLYNENFTNYNINDFIFLDEDNSKHLIKSLRMKIGDNVSISDSKGNNFITSVYEVNNNVKLKIDKIDEENRELDIDITLIQGTPKADKLEFISQKACELGASKIIVVNMKRSIAKLKDEKKIRRLQSIIDNASNQSRRQKRTEVSSISKIEDINYSEFDIVLCCYEDEKEIIIRDINIKGTNKIAIIIGPEGGIDLSEIIALKKHSNVQFISLGNRILRTETAGLTALSYLMLSC